MRWKVAFWQPVASNRSIRPPIEEGQKNSPLLCGEAGPKQGGCSKLSDVFSHHGRFGQYMSARDREKLKRDYIRARDGYRKAVIESRRSYEELVRRGLMPDDSQKSEQ